MERASLTSATEGSLILAAALETIILAGLALIIGRAGQGSAAVDAFLRLNDLLTKPFGLLIAAPAARQVAALLVYGALCAALTGALAWLDRRQALGY